VPLVVSRGDFDLQQQLHFAAHDVDKVPATRRLTTRLSCIPLRTKLRLERCVSNLSRAIEKNCERVAHERVTGQVITCTVLNFVVPIAVSLDFSRAPAQAPRPGIP
jgi:hypothetical protein